MTTFADKYRKKVAATATTTLAVSEPVTFASMYRKGSPNRVSRPEVVQQPTQPEPVKSQGSFPATKAAINKLKENPLSLPGEDWGTYGKKLFDSTIGSVVNSVFDEGQRIKDLFTGGTPSEIASKGIKVVSGAGNIVFSPITALFSGAEQIVGLGTIAKLISIPFSAAGDVGGGVAKSAINVLPIPEKDKESLRDAAQEIGALAGQIALGYGAKKVVPIAKEKMAELTKKFGPDGAKTIVDVATKKAEGANKPLAETYRKENRFPTEKTTDIQRNTFETVNLREGTQLERPIYDIKPGAQEPIKSVAKETPVYDKAVSDYQKKLDIFTKKPTPKSEAAVLEARKTVAQEKMKIETAEPIKTAEVTPTGTPIITEVIPKLHPESNINTRAVMLEKAAVEKGIISEMEAPKTHEIMRMKDQASRAVDFMNNQPIEFKKFLSGDNSVVPPELNPGSLYKAAEIRAMANKDVAMIRELSKSKIPTEAGQTLGALRSSDMNSPVKIVRYLQSKMQENATKGLKGKTPEKVKESIKKPLTEKIKKAGPNKYDLMNLLDKIKC